MTQALEDPDSTSKFGLIIKSGLLSGCIGALLSFLGVFVIIVISNSIGIDGLILTQSVLASSAVVSGVSINYIFTHAFSEPLRPNPNKTIFKALLVTTIFLSITFSLILISLVVSWRDLFYLYVMVYSIGMSFVFTVIPGILTQRLVN